MDAKSKKDGEAGGSIALQVTLFGFLLLLAMMVILTCIWKIVKLIAAFKMESRIEELEQMTANDQEVILSPREFRCGRILREVEARSQLVLAHPRCLLIAIVFFAAAV